MKALGWILRLGLGALFMVAGVAKLVDPTQFATEIANYRLLPQLAPWLAVVLPATEIVAGVVLAVAPLAWRRGAALLVGGLLVAFTVAVSGALLRGIDIDCGCFGSGSGPITWLTLARNLALLAAAAALFALEWWAENLRTGGTIKA
jgi:uncharacterized membrane protein YphA (DoxX/SURF4 family)